MFHQFAPILLAFIIVISQSISYITLLVTFLIVTQVITLDHHQQQEDEVDEEGRLQRQHPFVPPPVTINDNTNHSKNSPTNYRTLLKNLFVRVDGRIWC